MEINAFVESLHFPYLRLGLMLGNRSLQAEVLLDTGFDGDVALPASLVMDGEPPDDYLLWTLADGSEILAPAFLGHARVGSFAEFPVLVTAIGDEPLIGRGVSDRFTVTLDHGRRLVIEP